MIRNCQISLYHQKEHHFSYPMIPKLHSQLYSFQSYAHLKQGNCSPFPIRRQFKPPGLVVFHAFHTPAAFICWLRRQALISPEKQSKFAEKFTKILTSTRPAPAPPIAARTQKRSDANNGWVLLEQFRPEIL